MKMRTLRLRLRAALDDAYELRMLFEMQSRRMHEARAYWQAETGNTHHPDLGQLLEWLVARAKKGGAKCE